MAPVGTPTSSETNTTKRRHESVETPVSGQKRTRMTAAEQKRIQDDDLFKRISEHFDQSTAQLKTAFEIKFEEMGTKVNSNTANIVEIKSCLLYTSPSPRDRQKSRMPSSA